MPAAPSVARAAHPEQFVTGETADAWLMRRVRMRRSANMTVGGELMVPASRWRLTADVAQGPEAWRHGLGTEHNEMGPQPPARQVPVQ